MKEGSCRLDNLGDDAGSFKETGRDMVLGVVDNAIFSEVIKRLPDIDDESGSSVELVDCW